MHCDNFVFIVQIQHQARELTTTTTNVRGESPTTWWHRCHPSPPPWLPRERPPAGGQRASLPSTQSPRLEPMPAEGLLSQQEAAGCGGGWIWANPLERWEVGACPVQATGNTPLDWLVHTTTTTTTTHPEIRTTCFNQDTLFQPSAIELSSSGRLSNQDTLSRSPYYYYYYYYYTLKWRQLVLIRTLCFIPMQ